MKRGRSSGSDNAGGVDDATGSIAAGCCPRWDQDQAHKKTYCREHIRACSVDKSERADTQRGVALPQVSGKCESVWRAPGESTEGVSGVGLRGREGAMRKPWRQSLQVLAAMKMYVQALEAATPSSSELQSAESAQVGARAPSGGTEVAAIEERDER